VGRALDDPRHAPVRVLSLAGAASAGRAAPFDVRSAHGSRARLILLALRERARRPRPTHVVCLHVHLSPVTLGLVGAAGRVTVLLNGIEAWKPARPAQALALRRSHRLVAISAHTAERFRAANTRLAQRDIAICHPGVPEPERPVASPVTGPPGFALIVGRMATAERYKGHDLLLDAWPKVTAVVPGARLVVVGDGDDRARLETRARAAGRAVSFHGRLSDAELARAYADCAFFVMPSRAEGFGLVYLEAMRAGRACIAGAGAPAELVEDGVTGLVVDPTEPDGVLKATLRLFREPATRERMGRAGAERVAREFTEAHFRRRFRAAVGARP
jgi:phosphatidylinositol alpha-1,6-mannosyltransferase